MSSRHVYIFHCCMIILMLSGCWDESNIEDHGFIVGFAIDLAEEDTNGQPQITVTNQFIIPAGIGTPSDGGEESNQAFMNLTATGNSIFAIDHQIRKYTSKVPFFEHAMLIAISEEVLEVPHLFPNLMDLYIRNYAIRRGTKVIVVKGEAKNVFEITPQNEKVPALYLNELLETNEQYTGGFDSVRLGDMHEHFLMSESFTIPQFVPREKHVEFKSESVFNGEEEVLLGSLEGQDVDGLHLMLGTYERGPIEFEHDGAFVTYDIELATSNIKMNIQNDETISVFVDIHTEGRIVEVFGTQSIRDSKTIHEIEQKASKQIEDIVKQTIVHAQDELKTDIFGLKRELRQRHYDIWEKLKDEWDIGINYFSQITFDVKASVTIQSVGDAEKSQGNNQRE